MAAKIIILDQQFRPITHHTTSAHTKNLAGCAGEVMVAKIEFAFRVECEFTGLKFSVQDNDSKFLRAEFTQDAINEGFSVGDYLYGTGIAGGPYLPIGTATVVAKNYIVIQRINITDLGWFAEGDNNDICGVIAINDITTIRFKPNIVNNNVKWNEKDYLTGEKIEFLALNVGYRDGGIRQTDYFNLNPQGNDNYQYNANYSSITDLTMNTPVVKYVGQINCGGDTSGEETWYQKFIIEYQFIIPFYKLGQSSNLINYTQPADFAKSKKFTFNLQLGKNQADCGSKKELTFSETPGSVGWFGQNFAGYPKGMTVLSSGMNVGGVEQLNISEVLAGKTITTVLSGDMGLLSTNWITIYFAKLNIDNTEISDKTQFQNDILILDSIITKCDNSYYPLGGSSIVKLTGNFFVKAKAQFSYVPSVSLTLTYDVKISDSHKNDLSDGDKFAIWYVVQNDATYNSNASQSNRYSDLIAVGTFVEGEDIEGLADINNSYLIDESGQVTTDNTVWIEDNIKTVFDIALNELTNNGVTYRTRVNSLSIAQVAHNESTNEYFILANYDLPLNIKESAGTQLIDYSEDRTDYILPANNAFRHVSVLSDGSLLSVVFGQKTDWQSWLALDGIISDSFFDITKPFDGAAHDASLYSGLNGFKIKNAVIARLEGINRKGAIATSPYLFLSNELECRTYSLDNARTDIRGVHGKIQINALNKTDILRPVVGKQNTIVASFYNDLGGFSSVGAETWATIRLEEIGETGKNINEVSTQWDGTKTAFKELRALLSAEYGYLTATATIQNSLLDALKSYKVTSHIEIDSSVAVVYDHKFIVIDLNFDSASGGDLFTSMQFTEINAVTDKLKCGYSGNSYWRTIKIENENENAFFDVVAECNTQTRERSSYFFSTKNLADFQTEKKYKFDIFASWWKGTPNPPIVGNGNINVDIRTYNSGFMVGLVRYLYSYTRLILNSVTGINVGNILFIGTGEYVVVTKSVTLKQVVLETIDNLTSFVGTTFVHNSVTYTINSCTNGGSLYEFTASDTAAAAALTSINIGGTDYAITVVDNFMYFDDLYDLSKNDGSYVNVGGTFANNLTKTYTVLSSSFSDVSSDGFEIEFTKMFTVSGSEINNKLTFSIE